MSENGKHIYECMFILDARSAKKDGDAVQEGLTKILTKHGVEVAGVHTWGERRMAYEIRRQKKGFYVLMHVKADPTCIDEMKQDLGLYEPLMRHFLLRIEAVPENFEFPSDPIDDRRDGRRSFGDSNRPGPTGPRPAPKPAEGEAAKPAEGEAAKPAESEAAKPAESEAAKPEAAAPAATGEGDATPASDEAAADAPEKKSE